MNSQEEIFDAQRSRLFGIAYRMLGSRADAEDALQDAYIRAPPEADRATARYLGQRVAETTLQFVRGRRR